MQPRRLLAASALLAAGTAAFVFARSHATGVETPDDVPSCCSGCAEAESGAECLAPSTCGDVDVVCPAGPGCFMPDVCPDHEVVCPADPAPAGS
jgi:hypothetical protein